MAPEPDRHDPAQIRALFHKLNNQLGVILSHAELLEEKLPDEKHRVRAAQIVAAALESLSLSREIGHGLD